MLLNAGKWNEAKDSAASALHAHSVQGDTQQPGFGLKVGTTSRASSINAFQCKMKGFLRQILAFFPIIGQAIDGMKDQFVVFMNERLYRLCRGSGIHNNSFRVLPCRNKNTFLATVMEMHEDRRL